MKRVVILGSTGSVGRNACRVAEALRDRVQVVGVAAKTNAAALAEQAEKLGCSQAWVWKTENGKVEATNDYQRAAVDLLRANQSRVVEIITMCAALIEPSGKVS